MRDEAHASALRGVLQQLRCAGHDGIYADRTDHASAGAFLLSSGPDNQSVSTAVFVSMGADRKGLANVEGVVLGCIEADFCNQILGWN